MKDKNYVVPLSLAASKAPSSTTRIVKSNNIHSWASNPYKRTYKASSSSKTQFLHNRSSNNAIQVRALKSSGVELKKIPHKVADTKPSSPNPQTLSENMLRQRLIEKRLLKAKETKVKEEVSIKSVALCPYDLLGTCLDKQCPYEHTSTQVSKTPSVANKSSNEKHSSVLKTSSLQPIVEPKEGSNSIAHTNDDSSSSDSSSDSEDSSDDDSSSSDDDSSDSSSDSSSESSPIESINANLKSSNDINDIANSEMQLVNPRNSFPKTDDDSCQEKKVASRPASCPPTFGGDWNPTQEVSFLDDCAKVLRKLHYNS